MPNGKRTRPATWNYSASAKRAYSKRARTAKSRGTTGMAGILRASVRRATKGVQRLNRMIETREGCWKTNTNIGYAHNLTAVIPLLGTAGNNPLTRGVGGQSVQDDPMTAGVMRTIGDAISIRGMKATFFLENSLARAKVYYRIQLIKGPRGADFTNIFKGITGNKMIDQLNTEKFTVIAQKRFTLTPSNNMSNGVNAAGEPLDIPSVAGDRTAGQANKIVNFWVPGAKFGRGGNIQYENGSTDLKFYDYRWVMTVYDWFGTPMNPITPNLVGRINEGYIKIYYKDA